MNSIEQNQIVTGDFHTHTQEFHPSTKETDFLMLMKAAATWGLQAIAVTDHNSIDPNIWSRVMDKSAQIPLVVFPGVELSTKYTRPHFGISFKGKPTVSFQQEISIHIGVFAVDAKEIKRVTDQLSNPPHTFETVLSSLNGRDCMVTLNHPMLPDQPSTSARMDAIKRIGDMDTSGVISAIEFSFKQKQELQKIAETYDWATVGGSDTHVGKGNWRKDLGSYAAHIRFKPRETRRTPNKVLQKMREAGSLKYQGIDPTVYPVRRQTNNLYRKLT